MSLTPDSICRWDPRWEPRTINTAFDLVRWETGSFTFDLLPAVCQLGTLPKNLLLFEHFSLSEIRTLRVTCYGWLVELCDNALEFQQLVYCRRHNLTWQQFLDSQVPDPPLAA